MLETARALHGSELSAEGLRDAVEPEPWLEVVESFEQGVAADARPGSPAEYDLRSLLSWLDRNPTVAGHPLAAGELAPGFDLVFARGSHAYTAYDGFVPGRAAVDGDDRIVSPTSLETWATCPFQYLLGSVLRLRDLPRPEETETISALDEGSLVHAILEDFVRAATPRATPDQPWDDADHRLMREITAARCAEAEQRGVTGRSVPWQLAKRRIHQTVERFLRTDPGLRAHFGVLPDLAGLEHAFGLDGRPPVSVPLADGRTVRFRGRIDRVDVAPDGSRVVVYDYKTGSSRAYDPIAQGDPVAGGKKLQLPVYALAAEQHHQISDAHAYYWFTRFEGDDALVGYPADHCRERFTETLTTIADGVELGCFPAVPGERTVDPLARARHVRALRELRVRPPVPGRPRVGVATQGRRGGDPPVPHLTEVEPTEREGAWSSRERTSASSSTRRRARASARRIPRACSSRPARERARPAHWSSGSSRSWPPGISSSVSWPRSRSPRRRRRSCATGSGRDSNRSPTVAPTRSRRRTSSAAAGPRSNRSTRPRSPRCTGSPSAS